MVVIALAIKLTSPGPVFYKQTRVGVDRRNPLRPGGNWRRQVDYGGRLFQVYKFRTMVADADRAGQVWATPEDPRITRVGGFLRKYRLDEIPQLWNVIRGEMSLVGPRPPLRRYVELRPDLYGRVLACRPGITGLATLVYHGHEERILARCATAAETEAAYLRRCVPWKARLDLLYADRRSLCWDAAILGRTAARLIRRRRSRRNPVRPPPRPRA
jgi:lipopolysaccharide/colanic/teichoic acid biosynthesis glycosyltransferase